MEYLLMFGFLAVFITAQVFVAKLSEKKRFLVTLVFGSILCAWMWIESSNSYIPIIMTVVIVSSIWNRWKEYKVEEVIS